MEINTKNKNLNLHKAAYGLEKNHAQYSIRLFLENIKNVSKVILYIAIFLLLTISIIFPQVSMLTLYTVLGILCLAVQLFKLIIICIGANSYQEKNTQELDQLPVYTILLPIYHEDKVLENLIASIKNIDYPSHLLDVKILIEEEDHQTLLAIKKIKLPEFFEVIIIPLAHPQTKPKACNYGLQYAKGKYVTIYDAEDIPGPKQLKQVVAEFAVADKRVIAIQAKLHFYNASENIISKLFSIDYALLYNFMLAGLSGLGLPIPLGGTSNHFIREKLEAIGGWDAFNVTEDADLGMRIYQQGYRTELIDSVTLEEATISLKSWLIQRSRWIKGHILTSLVHLQKNTNLTLKEKFGLYFTLLLPNISYALLPVYFVLNCLISETHNLDLLWQINIYLASILPIGYGMLLIITKKWKGFKAAIFFTPFYYLLLSLSAIRALVEILKRPFHWDKTEHGVSKLDKVV